MEKTISLAPIKPASSQRSEEIEARAGIALLKMREEFALNN
jgi:hypothetical protein